MWSNVSANLDLVRHDFTMGNVPLGERIGEVFVGDDQVQVKMRRCADGTLTFDFGVDEFYMVTMEDIARAIWKGRQFELVNHDQEAVQEVSALTRVPRTSKASTVLVDHPWYPNMGVFPSSPPAASPPPNPSLPGALPPEGEKGGGS